jgi:hypothetical protein
MGVIWGSKCLYPSPLECVLQLTWKGNAGGGLDIKYCLNALYENEMCVLFVIQNTSEMCNAVYPTSVRHGNGSSIAETA